MLLNGSSLGAEKAYTEKCREAIDVFFRKDHRMEGEEVEQQLNRRRAT